MESRKLVLAFDRPSDSSSLEKWAAYVEKYVSLGLRQKGWQINLISSLQEYIPSPEAKIIYVPVLTSSTLSLELFVNRVKDVLGQPSIGEGIVLGVLKESVAAESAASIFPEVPQFSLSLTDPENGLEVPQEELWSKDYLELFQFKIFDLCNEIENRITLKNGEKKQEERKSVYLAETTPDLQSSREALRRELINKGFAVYPDKLISGELKELENAIFEYLQRSMLSIHLFGKIYQESKGGEVPRCELENKVAANYILSKKEFKKSSQVLKRIIWTPDHLVVNDAKQEAFLKDLLRNKKSYAGAEIITSSLEELKDIIIERLDHMEIPKENVRSSKRKTSPQSGKRIFILVKEKDATDTELVKKEDMAG